MRFFVRECIIILVSASVIGIIFMLGKFPGNKSFENQMAYFFSTLCIFNFSVIVSRKLLKIIVVIWIH